MSNYLYYNLSGGVDLANSMTVLGQCKKEIFWEDSQNIEIYKSNGITKMKGNTEIASLPVQTEITGMFEYKKGSSKTLVVNTSDGKFYVHDGLNNSLVEKKSGLSTTKKPCYTNFLNGVVCSNGVDEAFFYEAGVEDEVKSCNCVDSAGHNIRGKAISSYAGRLWIGDSGTLYYSALGRFDDWASANDAGFIANFHNDSSDIVALEPYKEYLAIHKEDQTYLLTGTSPDNFAIVPFADKGSVSPQGVTTIENKQYFFNKGVYNLEQVGELNQIRLSAEISKVIHPEFNKLDTSRLDDLIILPYEAKRQVWFYLPYNDNAYFSVCWIYDYANNSWYKRVVPQNISCACVYDDKILTATNEGQILIEDCGKSFDGTPIEFSWASPFFWFSQPNKAKTIDEFYLTLDNIKTNNFNFATCKNYNTLTLEDQDNIISSYDDSLMWDLADWASINTPKIWAIGGEISINTPVYGSNKSVQVRISGSELCNDFALLGFEFRDVILDE